MHDPAWRDLLPHQRAAYLHRIAALIERDAERLAQLQRQDNGKPILETRALVGSAAGTFRYFAAVCETLEGDIKIGRASRRERVCQYVETSGVAVTLKIKIHNRQNEKHETSIQEG